MHLAALAAIVAEIVAQGVTYVPEHFAVSSIIRCLRGGLRLNPMGGHTTILLLGIPHGNDRLHRLLNFLHTLVIKQ